MSDEKSEFVIYVCFQMGEESDQRTSLLVTSTHKAIDEWKTARRTAVSKQEGKSEKEVEVSDQVETELNAEPETEPEQKEMSKPSDQLADLMVKFHESISSFQPLITFGTAVMPMVKVL